MESPQESTHQTSSFRNKLPYYILPACKTGIITGAIVCVIDSNLKVVINSIIPKSSPLNDISTNSYYDEIRYLIQTLLLACIFIFGIFYGIRKVKSIKIATESFSFIKAFVTGCVVTLVMFGLVECTRIFNLITYIGTSQFPLKEAIMRSLSGTFFPALLVGFICSLILSIFLKSKQKEINTKQ
jgi:hypothetical protein